MIFTGKIDRVLKSEQSTIISFEVPNYQAYMFKEIKPIDYRIELKEVKSKKTLQQNNYAWALMTEIAKQLDIFPEPEDVYLQVVKKAKIKTEYIMVENNEQVLERLKKVFRAMIERDKRISEKGKEMIVLECSYGMSTFDKEEMSRFIEALLHYAMEVGIHVEYQF